MLHRRVFRVFKVNDFLFSAKLFFLHGDVVEANPQNSTIVRILAVYGEKPRTFNEMRARARKLVAIFHICGYRAFNNVNTCAFYSFEYYKKKNPVGNCKFSYCHCHHRSTMYLFCRVRTDSSFILLLSIALAKKGKIRIIMCDGK